MAQMQNQALEIIENDERESYDELIKQQVENVISLCQVIYDKYQAGEYTEDEAKRLRQMRFVHFVMERVVISGLTSTMAQM